MELSFWKEYILLHQKKYFFEISALKAEQNKLFSTWLLSGKLISSSYELYFMLIQDILVKKIK